MKRMTVFLAITLGWVFLFTACSGNNQAVSTSASAATADSTAAGTPAKAEEKAENVPTDLYPAYVMSEQGKKWGYINEEGTFVIGPKFDYVSDFRHNGLADVMENGNAGQIDVSGNLAVKAHYSHTEDYTDKVTLALDNSGESYLLDENNRILFQTNGSISNLSCGLAPFSKLVEGNRYLWGYMDEEYRVVIEPQYEYANRFSNDRGIVKIREGHFGIIDKEGKLLKEIETQNIIDISEGLMTFVADKGNYNYKYGYMDLDGNIVQEAVYSDAQKFENGLAIVNTQEFYMDTYGVINRNGEFVIPAKYGRITSLGNGIYAVPGTNDPEGYYSISYVKKALFDQNGKQLTDFLYYDLNRLENGMLSVTDDTHTFLIDENGNEVSGFPEIVGIGSITALSKLYKVEVDNQLYYLSQDGKIIWKSDNTIRLDRGLEAAMRTFRPDRCKLIQYPEITGLADANVQAKINGNLKEEFVGDATGSLREGDLYTETIEISYTVEQNKDLLIVRKNGYYYPIGAAHGQPVMRDYHIDIKTGKFYSLEDLFKKDSGYQEKLLKMIQQKIAKINAELGGQILSEDIGGLDRIGGFTSRKDSLLIYYDPYAIGAYAIGFPELYIEYDELMDYINTDSAFWNAFDREAPVTTLKPGNEVYTGDRTKIVEAIENYEKTLIEAINENNFQRVEPWLYPDSSLYISQKNLVANLYGKNIKERLDGYTIEEIETDYFGVIRVYVTENIAIKYPGKEYENKQYNWVYSLAYSYDKNQYQLTYIDKW